MGVGMVQYEPRLPSATGTTIGGVGRVFRIEDGLV